MAEHSNPNLSHIHKLRQISVYHILPQVWNPRNGSHKKFLTNILGSKPDIWKM